MKKILLLVFSFLPSFIFSQTLIKTDLRTWFASSNNIKLSVNGQLDLLVEADEQSLKFFLSTIKGVYRYRNNNFHSISIPESQLSSLLGLSKITRVIYDHSIGHSLMDTARIRNNADSAFAGISPLSQSYKGKGVIIGVIDGSLFYNHEDFKWPNGKTRIRHIWDQTNTTPSAPAPFGYGSSWDSSHINSGTCTFPSVLGDNGHGSCVTGIAAGDGSSQSANPNLQNTYRGIAPESEIIFVRFKNSNFNQSIADAVSYIFARASEIGKPCVINISLGSFSGPHDGSELFVQQIDNAITAQPGRAVVSAAGNFGNKQFHLSHSIQSDSLITFFRYYSAISGVYFDLWADTAQFSLAQFSIGCYDRFGNFRNRLNTYRTIPGDYNPPQGGTVVKTDTLKLGLITLGIINTAATLDGNKWHLEVYITSVNTNSNIWSFQTKGSGKFHCWSGQGEVGTSNIASTWASLVSPFPQIPITHPRYVFPDSLLSIAGGWQCSDKVITVANYSSRAGYYDIDSVYRDLTVSPYLETVHKRISNSSVGPTFDNRLKPDVSAAGITILCSGDSVVINSFLPSPSNRLKIALGGKHLRNGGTSMASPMVAGLGALFFEKNPTFGWQELKAAVIASAKKDSYTGASANPYYGHGKLDIYRALLVVPGCTDPYSQNFNPAANFEFGNCESYHWTGSTNTNWNDSTNWFANRKPSCSVGAVIIPSSNQPIVSIDTPEVRDLRILSGAQFINNSGLKLCGDFRNNGNSNVGSGLFIFQGLADSISGNSTISNARFSGNYIHTSGSQLNITQSIDLIGQLNNQGSCKLLSNAAQTAYLKDNPGNNFIGNIEVQRYIGGSIGYKYLSNPVNAANINQWADDFSIVGANAKDMTLYLNPYPNLVRYVETNVNANFNKGWYSYTTQTQPIEKCRGYGVRLSATPANFDITGAPSKGNFSYNITKTNSGNPAADGWNLIGNPYPSPISWNQLLSSNLSALDSTVYLWSSTGLYTGNYATWNGILGVNGGNDVISSSQGFFVLSKTASSTVNFEDAQRVYSYNPIFFKKELSECHLVLSNEIHSDEIAVFSYETPLNSLKLFSSEEEVPSLYLFKNELPYSILSEEQIHSETKYSLGVEIKKSGNYFFKIPSEFNTTGLTPWLFDLATKKSYNLQETNPQFYFESAYSNNQRFELRFANSESEKVTGMQFIQFQNTFYLKGNQEVVEFKLTDISGKKVFEGIVSGEENIDFRHLVKGVYLISLNGNGFHEYHKVIVH